MKNINKQKNNSGITLIALVVTIIVLLILAGLVIYLDLKDGGIFERAQNATLIYDVERVREEIEIVRGSVLIDNLGKMDKDDFFDELIDEGIVISRDDIVDNGNDTYDITTKEGYVFLIIIKDNGDIDIIYIGDKDKLGPRIRGIDIKEKETNKIAIEVRTDYAEDAEYTYLYKKNDQEEYKEEEKGKDITSCKFEGLIQKEIYNIKVIVENKKGKDERVINVLTDEMPTEAITIGDLKWENEKASVVVNVLEEYADKYTIEYKVGADGEWIVIQNGERIGNLVDEDEVYVRLFDGINESIYASVSIDDNINPSVSIKAGTITSNSIQVTVTAADGESGLNGTYKYYLNGELKDTLNTNSYTYSGLADETEYVLKVEVEDKAENKNSADTKQKTIKVPSGTESGAITFTNPTWSGGKASIKVSTNTNYQIEYQKNSTSGSWTKIANGGTISDLVHGNTVYARLTDGVNSGDYASSSIKDTTQPTVTVKVSNLLPNSVTLTATASDGQSGIKNYQFFLGSTSKATQTGNSYNYTGLAEQKSYTLKVIVTDNAGNKKEASTSITTPKSNTAPKISSVAYSTKTTNSLTIKATATDTDAGDKLTYELYTSTSQNSGFTKKATLSNQTPGTAVTLTASRLSQYTYYYYYVKVTDGDETVQSPTQERIRTYCPGNTSHCSGGTRCSGGTTCNPTTEKCWPCSGTGNQSKTCPTCNGSTWVGNKPCTACGGDGMVPITCPSCGGSGSKVTPCPHGKTTSHKVPCSHGNTSSHTIRCSHGKTSAHDYCAHSNNGKQHD